MGPDGSILKLQGIASSGQQVIVRLHDWHDPWECIGAGDLLKNEPKIISPQFAREAIDFALAHGWIPTEAGPALSIDYRDKSFSIRRDGSG